MSKKLLALVLALSLCMAMGAPAFAGKSNISTLSPVKGLEGTVFQSTSRSNQFYICGNANAMVPVSRLNIQPDDNETINKLVSEYHVQQKTADYVENLCQAYHDGEIPELDSITLFFSSPLTRSSSYPGYGGYMYKSDVAQVHTTPNLIGTEFISGGSTPLLGALTISTAIECIIGTAIDSTSHNAFSMAQLFGNIFKTDGSPSNHDKAHVSIGEDKIVRFTYCEKILNSGNFQLGCQTEKSTFNIEPQMQIDGVTRVGGFKHVTKSTDSYNIPSTEQYLAASYAGLAPHYVEKITRYEFGNVSYYSIQY